MTSSYCGLHGGRGKERLQADMDEMEENGKRRAQGRYEAEGGFGPLLGYDVHGQ